jgi:hypothetical protein
LARCMKKPPPFWISVEGVMIPVEGTDCLQLACHICAAYHAWVAYNAPEDDGFTADMEDREAKIQQHMDEPSSDESDSLQEDE